MKRVTSWPQAVLGLAFSWGALMGWAATFGSLALAPVLLYFGASPGRSATTRSTPCRTRATTPSSASARRRACSPAHARLGVGLFYALAAALALAAILLRRRRARSRSSAGSPTPRHLGWQLSQVEGADAATALQPVPLQSRRGASAVRRHRGAGRGRVSARPAGAQRTKSAAQSYGAASVFSSEVAWSGRTPVAFRDAPIGREHPRSADEARVAPRSAAWRRAPDQFPIRAQGEGAATSIPRVTGSAGQFRAAGTDSAIRGRTAIDEGTPSSCRPLVGDAMASPRLRAARPSPAESEALDHDACVRNAQPFDVAPCQRPGPRPRP